MRSRTREDVIHGRFLKQAANSQISERRVECPLGYERDDLGLLCFLKALSSGAGTEKAGEKFINSQYEHPLEPLWVASLGVV